MNLILAFNSGIAAAGYLDTIDPVREARAIAYTHGAHWIALWEWVVAVVVDLLILRSGMLLRLAGRIEHAGRRPNLVAFACTCVFVAVLGIVRLPFAAYAEWWRERAYGLTRAGLAEWLVPSLMSLLVAAVVLGLVAVPFYALIRRTGRRWWLWAGGITTVLSFVAVVAVPAAIDRLSGSAQPLPAGSARDSVVALASQAQIPADRIVMEQAGPDSRYSATVIGGPGFATIRLGAPLVQEPLDLPALRAVTAHEIGHYAHGHLLLLALVVSVLLLVWLALVQWLFGRIRAGEQLIANPAAIPLLHLVLASFMLLTGPVLLAAQRWVEADADAYGLALANEPDGAARALLRTVDFRASAPGRVEEVLFYDHPSIARRVRQAMEWKARHPANAE